MNTKKVAGAARACGAIMTALITLSAVGGCDLPDQAATPTQDEIGSSAITVGPARCPTTLTARRTTVDVLDRPLVVLTTVPGPMSAGIIANAQQISCGPTNAREIMVGETRWTAAFAPDPERITIKGNELFVNPPLQAQKTPRGWMAIEGFICPVGDTRLEGSGWPDRALATRVEFEWSQTGAWLNVLCRVYAKPPITVVQTRPTDLVSTSGDRFIYRCDLTGTARRNACSGLCGNQCTGNIGFPPDSAGINRCIADCTDRCASNTGCQPPICSGSDCPAGCSPDNLCTTNGQCGTGRTCSAGCCLTIIH